jgi:hypothetical protein
MTKDHTQYKSLSDISDLNWQQLSKKKIFFAHQSVGNNIIKGINVVLNDNPKIKLNIIETKSQDDFSSPVFAHFRVGENFDPLSKNNDFSSMINDGIGQKTDIAFYKYCYIDINENTDVNALFSAYKENMISLKNKFPKVDFVHVTVPLVVVQSGPRAWVKKIIGRKIGGYDANIKRNEFNDLIRNEYNTAEPIFDLALFEATYPDGRLMTFKKNGKTYYSLIPDYASDGRHLNDKGSRFVAEQLLILLAELSGE